MVAIALLLGMLALSLWLDRGSQAAPSPTELELRANRQRIDGGLLRAEIRRDADALRRELDAELDAVDRNQRRPE